MQQFPNLMSTAMIGNVEIPNRIVSVPIGAALATDDGYVTPRLIAAYVERAKGGTGLIIVEATYIDRIVSKGEENSLGAYDNSCGAGLALLATAIHDWGVKCGLQLCHMGPQLGLWDKLWSAAPSDGVHGPLQIPLRGLTKEEIKEVIQAHAMAALRVKMAGFDMVEIHAAHTHLYHTFLSTGFNKRTDEYGGSIENRARIITETVQAIQAMCGPDFPILVRLGQDREKENPVTIDDVIAVSKILEETGVAAIDLGGGSTLNWYTPIPMYENRAFNLPDSVAMKKAGVKIPIIVAGGITTPDIAEEMLAKGDADFAGLGRPILADPYWAKKIEAGTPEDIVPCIRCNMGCIGTTEDFMSARGIRCAVNPRCALETIRQVAPLEKKKKVAVIGGGPGGIEAARIASMRGHDVTLYEKRQLGGVLHEGSWDLTLKGDMAILKDYFVAQAKKLDISIVEEEATADTIINGGYDAVIVAVGAKANTLPIPGVDKPHVYTDLEMTGGKYTELGDTVIIVGGGVIAAEIAVSESRKGKKVILTTRRTDVSQLAEDEGLVNGMCLLDMLQNSPIEINLGLTIKEITDDGIISVDKEGTERQFKGDNVVLCFGYLPDLDLAKALKGKIKEVRAVGDCVKPRLVGSAISEGWLAGNQI